MERFTMNATAIEVVSDSRKVVIPLNIPKLRDDELLALAERIKPVVKYGQVTAPRNSSARYN